MPPGGSTNLVSDDLTLDVCSSEVIPSLSKPSPWTQLAGGVTDCQRITHGLSFLPLLFQCCHPVQLLKSGPSSKVCSSPTSCRTSETHSGPLQAWLCRPHTGHLSFYFLLINCDVSLGPSHLSGSQKRVLRGSLST